MCMHREPRFPVSLPAVVPRANTQGCQAQGTTELSSLISAQNPSRERAFSYFFPHLGQNFKCMRNGSSWVAWMLTGPWGPVQSAKLQHLCAQPLVAETGTQACSCQLGYLFLRLSATFPPARLRSTLMEGNQLLPSF